MPYSILLPTDEKEKIIWIKTIRVLVEKLKSNLNQDFFSLSSEDKALLHKTAVEKENEPQVTHSIGDMVILSIKSQILSMSEDILISTINNIAHDVRQIYQAYLPIDRISQEIVSSINFPLNSQKIFIEKFIKALKDNRNLLEATIKEKISKIAQKDFPIETKRAFTKTIIEIFVEHISDKNIRQKICEFIKNPANCAYLHNHTNPNWDAAISKLDYFNFFKMEETRAYRDLYSLLENGPKKSDHSFLLCNFAPE